ncbi:MAG: hypothetical protein M5U13_15055 [Thermoanaerobaculia bacterium]|nr:hypothetical protein [Thermoanaerobaculia bacterium]
MLAKRTNRTSTNYFVYTADDERYWTYHPGGASSFALRDLDGRVLRVYSSWGGAGTRYTDYVYRGARLLARDTPYARAEAMHLDREGAERVPGDFCGRELIRGTPGGWGGASHPRRDV